MISCNKKLKSAAKGFLCGMLLYLFMIFMTGHFTFSDYLKFRRIFETTPIRNNEVFLLWSGWLPNKFVLLH